MAPYWWIPVIAAIVVPIISWISSCLIYAFGELVDSTSDIRDCIKIDSDRIDKINKLRSRDLITEEEYQQAMSNIMKWRRRKNDTAKIDPESELRLLKYKLNLEIITKEDYEAQRAEIIKRL